MPVVRREPERQQLLFRHGAARAGRPRGCGRTRTACLTARSGLSLRNGVTTATPPSCARAPLPSAATPRRAAPCSGRPRAGRQPRSSLSSCAISGNTAEQTLRAIPSVRPPASQPARAPQATLHDRHRVAAGWAGPWPHPSPSRPAQAGEPTNQPTNQPSRPYVVHDDALQHRVALAAEHTQRLQVRRAHHPPPQQLYLYYLIFDSTDEPRAPLLRLYPFEGKKETKKHVDPFRKSETAGRSDLGE